MYTDKKDNIDTRRQCVQRFVAGYHSIKGEVCVGMPLCAHSLAKKAVKISDRIRVAARMAPGLIGGDLNEISVGFLYSFRTLQAGLWFKTGCTYLRIICKYEDM